MSRFREEIEQDVAVWQQHIEEEEDGEGIASDLGVAAALFGAATITFASMLRILALNEARFDSESYRMLRTEFRRFYLWNEGFATRSGELDRILSLSGNLKATVLGLMVRWVMAVAKVPELYSDYDWLSIASNLSNLEVLTQKADQVAKAVKAETRICYLLDEIDTSDPDSDSDSFDSDDEVIFEDVIEDLRIYMECLLDISPSLEHPAIDAVQITPKAIFADDLSSVSEPAQPFVRIIKDRFPSIDSELARKLGECNWIRRERLREKLASALSDEQIILNQDEGTESQIDETIVSTEHQAGQTHAASSASHLSSEVTSHHQSTTTASTFSDLSMFDTASFSVPLPSRPRIAESITSFATSMADGLEQGQRRVPSLPENHDFQLPLICQVCGLLLTAIRNRADWKKHVYDDLEPYICLFPECPAGPHTFSSRSDWISHEFQYHRISAQWHCNLCQEIFQDHQSFSGHLRQVHAEDFATHQIEELTTAARRIVPRFAGNEICPFCITNPALSQIGFARHVGKHQQEISLAALPTLEAATNDRHSEDDSDSDHGNGDDNEAASSHSSDATEKPANSNSGDSNGQPDEHGKPENDEMIPKATDPEVSSRVYNAMAQSRIESLNNYHESLFTAMSRYKSLLQGLITMRGDWIVDLRRSIDTLREGKEMLSNAIDVLLEQYRLPLYAAELQPHTVNLTLALEKYREVQTHIVNTEKLFEHAGKPERLLWITSDTIIEALELAKPILHILLTVPSLLPKSNEPNNVEQSFLKATRCILNGDLSQLQSVWEEGLSVDESVEALGILLQLAALEGNHQIIQFLLDKGADPKIRGWHYGNALQTASARGHVQTLLAHGADRAISGGKHISPLEAAAIHDRTPNDRTPNIPPLRRHATKMYDLNSLYSKANHRTNPPLSSQGPTTRAAPNLGLMAKEVHETNSEHGQNEEEEDWTCNSCKKKFDWGEKLISAHENGNRWHKECFRCGICNNLMEAGSTLQTKDSLLCDQCASSCTFCKNKIGEKAIVEGTMVCCRDCFCCRECYKQLDDLPTESYKWFSDGIVCQPCQGIEEGKHQGPMLNTTDETANSTVKGKELPLLSVYNARSPRYLSSISSSSSTVSPQDSKRTSQPYSGIFDSAMPFKDGLDNNQALSQYSILSRTRSYNPLYLAASLFEFNKTSTELNAGFPWLTYMAGEIFDVVAERRVKDEEIWLAKNQDDPNDRFGWIWSKHFARLPSD